MEVFRIARDIYAKELVASGVANRWNLDQQWVIYTGSSRSLATLELVVHRGAVKPHFAYQVMVISVADDDHLVSSVREADLPADWRRVNQYPVLQQIGSEWYKERQSLLLRVPSAVIPKEHNFIINSRHPDFQQHVQLARQEAYFWDERLLL